MPCQLVKGPCDASEPTAKAHALFGPFAPASVDTVSMAMVEAPANGAITMAPPYSDAFLLSVQMIDAPQRRTWQDGVEAVHDLFAGDTVVYDLRCAPQILLDRRYSAVNIHIPRVAFDRAAELAKTGPFIDLTGICTPVRDETVLNIAHTLLATLRVSPRHGLFVEHLTLALVTHVAHAYGDLIPRGAHQGAGLAPWQMQRAKTALLADLNKRVSLREVAELCDLSLSHFSRSFRKSFGEAPYQFVLKARIEAAKALIRQHDMAMVDISLACGFADQSHMTRVFSREVGVSPTVWRRTEAEGPAL